jgi:hypothetical protein
LTFLLASLLFLQPDAPKSAASTPTPAQLQTADFAALKSDYLELGRELEAKRVESGWSVLYAILGTGGAMTAFGAFIINLINTRHKNAMELSRSNAELKADDREAEMTHDNLIIASLQAEVQRQGAEIVRLHDRIRDEEKLTKQMREEMFYLAKHGSESAYAEISVDTEGKVAFLTTAFERQVLDPMGLQRELVMRKPYAAFFPAEIVAQISRLHEEAFAHPSHTAWCDDFVFHPKMGSHVVCKTLHRHHDRNIGVSLVVFPAANKIAKLPQPKGPQP